MNSKILLALIFVITSCNKSFDITAKNDNPKYFIHGYLSNNKRLRLNIAKLFSTYELPYVKNIPWYDKINHSIDILSDTIAPPFRISITSSMGKKYDTIYHSLPERPLHYYYEFLYGPKPKYGIGYKIELWFEGYHVVQYTQIPKQVEFDTAIWANHTDSTSKEIHLITHSPFEIQNDTFYFINDLIYHPYDYKVDIASLSFQNSVDVNITKYINFGQALGLILSYFNNNNYNVEKVKLSYLNQVKSGTYIEYYPAQYYRYAMKRNQISRYNNSGPVAGPLPYPHMAGQDQDVYGYIVGYGHTYIKFDL